jgi:hypothetical protein
MDKEKLLRILSGNAHASFAGNEVMFYPRDFCNGVKVVSTGDPEKYKIIRSIRKGIVHEEVVLLEDVAHLYVEMAAEEVLPKVNLLFPKGLEDAMAICQERYRKEVEPLLKEEKEVTKKPRGYTSLHNTEYWDDAKDILHSA